jgi:hypothetical protein
MMRPFLTIPIVLLAMFAAEPRPAAALALTYDFSATPEHGPSGDPGMSGIITVRSWS